MDEQDTKASASKAMLAFCVLVVALLVAPAVHDWLSAGSRLP